MSSAKQAPTPSPHVRGHYDHRMADAGTPSLYFAYGSNLSLAQMARRCPAARAMSRAVLHGYRLSFPRLGSNWTGGVAGIEPDAIARVEGAVYRVTAACLRTLDAMEGVGSLRYQRVTVSVVMPDAQAMEAATYVATPEPGGPFEPSAQYVRVIMQGAREHGLSACHVSQLTQWLSLSS